MQFCGAVVTALYFSVGIFLSSSKKGSKAWCSVSGMSFEGTSLSTWKSILSVAGFFFLCYIFIGLWSFFGIGQIYFAFIVELALLVFLCSLLICCFACSACGFYGVIKEFSQFFFEISFMIWFLKCVSAGWSYCWLIYSFIFFKWESLAGPVLLLSILFEFLFVTFTSGVLDKVILIGVLLDYLRICSDKIRYPSLLE